MFYIWTAIKFLKKALVSLVLMKSFVSPRQHIPCGEGYFPPISDIVNSHRDGQGTIFSCCILLFPKGTRNPAIQHIPQHALEVVAAKQSVKHARLGCLLGKRPVPKIQLAASEGWKILDLSSQTMPNNHMQADSSLQKLYFSRSEVPTLLSFYFLPPLPPNSLLLLLTSQWCPWQSGIWLTSGFFYFIIFFYCIVFPREKDVICVPKVYFFWAVLVKINTNIGPWGYICIPSFEKKQRSSKC